MRSVWISYQLKLLLSSVGWISWGRFGLFSLIFADSYVLVLVLVNLVLNNHSSMDSLLVFVLHIVQVLHVSLLSCDTGGHHHSIAILVFEIYTVLLTTQLVPLLVFLIRQRIIIVTRILQICLSIAQMIWRCVGLQMIILVGPVWIVNLLHILHLVAPIIGWSPVVGTNWILSGREGILPHVLLVRHVLLNHCIVVLLSTFGLSIRRHHQLFGRVLWLLLLLHLI